MLVPNISLVFCNMQTKTFIGKFLHRHNFHIQTNKTSQRTMASTFTIWYKLGTLVAASKGTFPNHALTLVPNFSAETIWSYTSITPCCSKRQQWKLARFRALFCFAKTTINKQKLHLHPLMSSSMSHISNFLPYFSLFTYFAHFDFTLSR
jgi:hypothetical protein